MTKKVVKKSMQYWDSWRWVQAALIVLPRKLLLVFFHRPCELRVRIRPSSPSTVPSSRRRGQAVSDNEQAIECALGSPFQEEESAH